jgi:hypothetical protein
MTTRAATQGAIGSKRSNVSAVLKLPLLLLLIPSNSSRPADLSTSVDIIDPDVFGFWFLELKDQLG